MEVLQKYSVLMSQVFTHTRDPQVRLASLWQACCYGHQLITCVRVQVRLSSKQTPHFLSDRSRPLSHARCLELANHCLGFNGWTSDIITVRNTHFFSSHFYIQVS